MCHYVLEREGMEEMDHCVLGCEGMEEMCHCMSVLTKWGKCVMVC